MNKVAKIIGLLGTIMLMSCNVFDNPIFPSGTLVYILTKAELGETLEKERNKKIKTNVKKIEIDMVFDIGSLAGAAASQGMNMIMQNRARDYAGAAAQAQYERQRLLNQQGQELGIKTWKETNYPAQVEMLKKAGLNVGLMYGKGSGAGGTTATGSGGSASKADMPNVPYMDINSINQAMQIASQTKLIQAQTKKTEEETRAIRGQAVSTELENWMKGFMQGDTSYYMTERETGKKMRWNEVLKRWGEGELTVAPDIERRFLETLETKARAGLVKNQEEIAYWEKKLKSMGITFTDDISIRMGLLLAKQNGVDIESAQGAAAVYDAIMSILPMVKKLGK